MAFGVPNLIVLGVYLVGMLGIGLFFARRQTSTEEYFLAGRSMPWWPVAMSMYASLTSASTYLVLPGKGFGDNIALLIVSVISPLVAPVLILLFYPAYRRLRVTTSYEYLGVRFGTEARWAASLLFILSRLGWLGIVVYAPAMAMSVMTGWSLWICIVALGLLSTLYTAMGGLAAVLWTDAVQFVILVGGAVWVLVTLLIQVPGGAPAIWQTAAEAGRLEGFGWKLSLTTTSAWVVGLSFFLQFLQDYGTDQVTVQRLMAVREDRGVVKAISFNALSDFLMVSMLIFIGLGILAYYTAAGAVPTLESNDQILPHFIMDVLPQGVSGLIVTAILAAAMSSMDSGINSLSTVVISDLVRPLRQRLGGPRVSAADEQSDLWWARVLTFALGVVVTGLAFVAARQGDILETFTTYMGMFSAPVLALFLLGLLTRRGTFMGWLVGAAVSIPTTWWLSHTMADQVNWAYRYPIAFALVMGVGYLASVLLPTRPRD